MSNLLYLEDAYLKEFDAVITEVDEQNKAVVLDQTAFYPTGGGQLCDTGTLVCGGAELKVTGVKKQSGKVLHFVEGTLPACGSKVHGIIDWERRYNNMRTHSAMHVLCGVMWNDHHAPVTGGNMEELSARMDFELEDLNSESLPHIEERVNEEINKNREIKVDVVPREKANQIDELIRTKVNLLPAGITEIRTIDIVGLDMQADGGTHVKNTSEIGYVKIIKFKSKGKNNKRLYVELS